MNNNLIEFIFSILIQKFEKTSFVLLGIIQTENFNVASMASKLLKNSITINQDNIVLINSLFLFVSTYLSLFEKQVVNEEGLYSIS